MKSLKNSAETLSQIRKKKRNKVLMIGISSLTQKWSLTEWKTLSKKEYQEMKRSLSQSASLSNIALTS